MTTVDRQAVVQAFCDECVWLHSIRKHFADLFEGNQQRDCLLSEVANTFFHDINVVLLEYIFLQQCKLTDPASSGANKENLTSNFILQLPWTHATKTVLEAENRKLLIFREKIVDARRKMIAHLDLRTRLQSLSLGQFSPSEEDDFWQALQNFVNAAHEEAIGGPFDIDATMPDGDAGNLIHSLKDAVDYDDLVNSEQDFLMQRVGKRRYEDA